MDMNILLDWTTSLVEPNGNGKLWLPCWMDMYDTLTPPKQFAFHIDWTAFISIVCLTIMRYIRALF